MSTRSSGFSQDRGRCCASDVPALRCRNARRSGHSHARIPGISYHPSMEGEQRPAGSLMVALLGPVRIGLAGQEMAPVAQQLLRVLTAMLGLAAGRAVSVPALIDGLWGEDATPERAKNLHSRISALQRLLEEAEPGRGGSRVVRSGDGYLLRLDPGLPGRAGIHRAGRTRARDGAVRGHSRGRRPVPGSAGAVAGPGGGGRGTLVPVAGGRGSAA